MKKYILFFIGISLLPLAISLIARSNFGADTFTAFAIALSDVITVKLGTAQIIVNVTLLVIHFLKFRNIKYTFFGFLLSLYSGFAINLVTNPLVENLPNELLYQQIILFIIAFSLVALSLALIQLSGVLKFPYESFQLVLSKIFKKDINFIRVFAEVGFLIMSFILFVFVLNYKFSHIKDILGIGTIITMLLTGPYIHLIYKTISRGEKK